MKRIKSIWPVQSKVHFIAILLVLVPVVAPCQTHSAPSQKAPAQRRPVSLAHLYWHFLVFQNFLDSKAAEMDAKARDGRSLHNNLQMRMGFSDAEYAPIRASSGRLSSRLKALDAQAAAIRAEGASPLKVARFKALTAQREIYINAEISALKKSLPPDRIAAFESFITQFFAPKPLTVQITPSGQAMQAAQP